MLNNEKQKVDGAQLRKARQILELNQTELGKLVDRSQKLVSNWENGQQPIPASVVALVRRKLGATRFADLMRAPPQRLPSLSYPEAAWEPLRAAFDCRVGRVQVEATVFAGQGEGADMHIRTRFERFELPPGIRFELDHIAGPGAKVRLQGGGIEAERAVIAEAPRDRTYEIDDSQRALRYELSRVDANDVIVVKLEVENAFPLKGVGSAGFALNPELLARRVDVEVIFRGLTPDAITSVAYPLRRNTWAPECLASALRPPAELAIAEKNARGYALGSIERPRGGAFYGIAWGALEHTTEPDPFADQP